MHPDGGQKSLKIKFSFYCSRLFLSTMTDLIYFSEFLSILFGISRKDYIVEKMNSDVDITDSNMTEGETIEDIELEIADIMKAKECLKTTGVREGIEKCS